MSCYYKDKDVYILKTKHGDYECVGCNLAGNRIVFLYTEKEAEMHLAEHTMTRSVWRNECCSCAAIPTVYCDDCERLHIPEDPCSSAPDFAKRLVCPGCGYEGCEECMSSGCCNCGK